MSDEYSVFSQICESSLIGYRNQLKNYDAKKIADLIFLYFIALQILKSNFASAPFAIDYANATNSGNFDDFRQSGTDLYVLIHVLFGKNNNLSINLLDNQAASQVFMQKLNFNITDVKRWLSNIKVIDEDADSRFLLKLETALKIDNGNYKSVRRLAGEWSSLDQTARELTMTRLLQAFQVHATRSELLPVLSRIAKSQNLIIKGVNNPEKDTPTSKKLLKTIGIGAAVTLGVAAHAIAKTIKNIDSHSSRK